MSSMAKLSCTLRKNAFSPAAAAAADWVSWLSVQPITKRKQKTVEEKWAPWGKLLPATKLMASLSLSFLFTFSKVLAFFRKHFATPLPVEESQPERTVTTTFVALVCSSWQRRIALCWQMVVVLLPAECTVTPGLSLFLFLAHYYRFSCFHVAVATAVWVGRSAIAWNLVQVQCDLRAE